MPPEPKKVRVEVHCKTFYTDLLTRLIFHYPKAADESEVRWCTLINSADIVRVSDFIDAWRVIVEKAAGLWRVDRMEMWEVVERCLERIGELCPDSDSDADDDADAETD